MVDCATTYAAWNKYICMQTEAGKEDEQKQEEKDEDRERQKI